MLSTLLMLLALLIKNVPVSGLMWWCMFNRKIMVGADVIKQGHGTLQLVVDVGNVETSVPMSEGEGAFVSGPELAESYLLMENIISVTPFLVSLNFQRKH